MNDRYRDNVDGSLLKVVEHKYHIEIFQPELYALQMDYFDIGKCNDGKGEFREVNQTVCRRL